MITLRKYDGVLRLNSVLYNLEFYDEQPALNNKLELEKAAGYRWGIQKGAIVEIFKTEKEFTQRRKFWKTSMILFEG